MNRKQFENGLLAWLCGARVSWVWRKKYRYGTAVLPRLPEYDREKYPFAVYCGEKRLFLLQNMAHLVLAHSDGTVYLGPGAGETYLMYLYHPTTVSWSLIGEYTNTGSSGMKMTADPVWSNYDILDQEGNVYLAASEPVPYFEEEK